jgi:pyruvate kinase
MKKTKIVVTIGPSIEKKEVLEKLIDIGVNVFRFNFSHGTHESHYNMLKKIREISENKAQYIATLMDLSGPKIRIGNLKQPIHVNSGDILTIKYGEFIGENNIIPLNIKEVFNSLKVNDLFFIADGIIKLNVLEKNDTEIKAEVLSNGTISSKKGLNLPNVKLNIPALTEKDKKDLEFGLEAGFDLIALSFVKTKEDILEAKNIIKKHNKDIPLFAKIEKNEAIDNIDEILEVCDGIMVARGDLGIEIEVERVPVVQKMLIKKANEKAKPVITATQMLTSMIKHPTPTRAEVSDISNAVLDGTDAVMLSDETTIGDYPVEAVKVMKKTIIETEKIYPYFRFSNNFNNMKISDAISETSSRLAMELKANGIVVFTKSGLTAKRVSRTKPFCPIYAISPDREVLRRLVITWGVIPYYKSIDTTNADKLILDFLKKSDKDFGRDNIFIITIGYPSGIPDSTNIIRTIRKQDYDFFLKNEH